MKKRLSDLGLIVALLALGMIVVGAVYFLSNRYITVANAKRQSTSVVCRKTGTNHKVIIANYNVIPEHTQATVCDTLTITNTDKTIRVIAFGPHDVHIPYDGITEKALSQGQSLTVTLNQLGVYGFHDHLHDIVAGDFTVAK